MYGSRVMFTGLIESVGRLERIDRTATGFRLVLATDLSGELVPGESLAVNGVCLTVVEAGADGVHADVSPETGRVTSLGTLEAGSLVNLDRIGGHFVQGHVDGTGRIEAIEREGDARRLRVTIPAGFELYVVEKGSIAVDGISLTVASLSNKHLDVQIIPFTWQHTNLRVARVGTLVNVECDILGKYVAKALGDRRG
jgi:riboflavin synthase